ncbi:MULTISPECIES: HupE/UreJ family protein [Moorena]|uniref:Hydrogenase/urease accessory protein n=1 Tax=Moorena producens 3L TaxID=489825 RepID=F4XT03_9CYAN|nr:MULTISPECIES: HupE/UreJ family protein [Moorena]EGJ32178.1 hydrogenase/urease accessory protein [Moorena producens 3L]
MSKSKFSPSNRSSISRYQNQKLGFNAMALLVWMGILSTAQQAMAHHPFGGERPDNFITGFLSGLGHPVIGFDHLAFVIAVGLIAAGFTSGFLIPGAFVLTTLVGTGIHLLGMDLPIPEIAIATSVVLFGGLLLSAKIPNISVVLGLASLAGIFHGYAYGEAIVGAEISPLLAYLIGFSVIQYGIAILALYLSKSLIKQWRDQPFPLMRILGFGICSVGVVFLSSAIFG